MAPKEKMVVEMESRSLETVPNWLHEEIRESVAGKDVVEIACGDGVFGSTIDSAHNYVGCDISHSKLRECDLEETVQLDGEKLPFKNNTFDVAISIETIEHFQKPELFVSELERVLKPEGVVYMKTPSRVAHDLLHVFDGNLAESKDWHPSVMRPGSLRSLLSESFSVDLYDSDIAGYQAKKIDDQIPIGDIASKIPFTRLPKVLQPSIIARGKLNQ